jgi:hypothetical protein
VIGRRLDVTVERQQMGTHCIESGAVMGIMSSPYSIPKLLELHHE